MTCHTAIYCGMVIPFLRQANKSLIRMTTKMRDKIDAAIAKCKGNLFSEKLYITPKAFIELQIQIVSVLIDISGSSESSGPLLLHFQKR